MKRFWNALISDRGQSMVELALVMPILLFIMLGMVTFGMAVNTKVAVSGAAREAARAYAVTDPGTGSPEANARNKAEAFLKGGVVASDAEFRQHFDKNDPRYVNIASDGTYVTVTVSYDQPSYVPGLFRLLNSSAASLGDAFRLTSSAVFKLER